MHFISVNIEGLKHLESRVIPFLQQEQPDVVCFQELFETSLPKLRAATGLEVVLAPMGNVLEDNPHLPPEGIFGVGLAVNPQKWQITHWEKHYYAGQADAPVPVFFADENPNSVFRVLLVAHVQSRQQPAEKYVVATTHFTWSPRGSFTQLQAENFETLTHFLEKIPEFVLCGDFNSPRNQPPAAEVGGLTTANAFNQLASRYQDTIPSHYTTSIDSSLHKSGQQIELMVDGLFTTPAYQAENVQLVKGVSDHLAIVAEVTLS